MAQAHRLTRYKKIIMEHSLDKIRVLEKGIKK
jgi:hypothetical protein